MATFNGTTTEFPSIDKIDFTKLCTYQLLTTGFFSGSKNSGYIRIDDMAEILANPRATNLYRGQYNINRLQQDKYEENEQHFTCIFPSDWNNSTRIPCNAFAETTSRNRNADSLQITKYFTTTLHINYRVWNTTKVKKIGQGNFEADWPDGQNSGDAPSKQSLLTHDRLPKGRHPNEDYAYQLQLMGKPTSYQDFWTKVEQIYKAYKQGIVGRDFAKQFEGKKKENFYNEKQPYWKNNQKHKEMHFSAKQDYVV
ncbi:2479_t:CDS:2, partial [Ambispora leptoticha]